MNVEPLHPLSGVAYLNVAAAIAVAVLAAALLFARSDGLRLWAARRAALLRTEPWATRAERAALVGVAVAALSNAATIHDPPLTAVVLKLAVAGFLGLLYAMCRRARHAGSAEPPTPG